MNPSFTWQEHSVEVKLSQRRSIALHVREGNIEIRAPKNTPISEAQAFLMSKQVWLAKTLEEQAHMLGGKIDYSRANRIPFMGIDVPLIRRPSHNRPNWKLCNDGLQLEASDFEDETAAIELLSDFYFQQARFWLTKKTKECAISHHLAHKLLDIRLRKTKTKWGHCTAEGRIQYNWLIMMAPEAVIDYLVYHEVSHLQHLNHSTAFWSLVESMQPDYKTHKRWLNREGHRLSLI